MSSQELQERLLEKLDGSQSKLLRALISHYPAAISRDELAAEVGYGNPKSGGFAEPIADLIAFGLAVSPSRGMVAASESLFLD